MGNIALFSVPRCTTEDTVVGGYHIPRGTWVFVNRWGLHASPRYWPNPQKFDPRRFIDKNGEVSQPEAFSPFGVGEYYSCCSCGDNVQKINFIHLDVIKYTIQKI